MSEDRNAYGFPGHQHQDMLLRIPGTISAVAMGAALAHLGLRLGQPVTLPSGEQVYPCEPLKQAPQLCRVCQALGRGDVPSSVVESGTYLCAEHWRECANR